MTFHKGRKYADYLEADARIDALDVYALYRYACLSQVDKGRKPNNERMFLNLDLGDVDGLVPVLYCEICSNEAVDFHLVDNAGESDSDFSDDEFDLDLPDNDYFDDGSETDDENKVEQVPHKVYRKIGDTTAYNNSNDYYANEGDNDIYITLPKPYLANGEFLHIRTRDWVDMKATSHGDSRFYMNISRVDDISAHECVVIANYPNIPENKRDFLDICAYCDKSISDLYNTKERNMEIDTQLLRENLDFFRNLIADKNTVVLPLVRKTYFKIKGGICLSFSTKKDGETYEKSIRECRLNEFKDDITEISEEYNVSIPFNDKLFSLEIEDDNSMFDVIKHFSSERYQTITIAADITGDVTRLKRIRSAAQKLATGTNVQNSKLVEIYCSRHLPAYSQPYIYDGLMINELKTKYPLLNAEQLETLEKVLRMDDSGTEIMLVQGPPGTGKTELIVSLAKELSARGKNTLITSNVHVACDNVVERVTGERELILKRYTVTPGDDRYPNEVYENIKRYLSRQVLAHFEINGRRIIEEADYQHARSELEQLNSELDNISGEYLKLKEKYSELLLTLELYDEEETSIKREAISKAKADIGKLKDELTTYERLKERQDEDLAKKKYELSTLLIKQKKMSNELSNQTEQRKSLENEYKLSLQTSIDIDNLERRLNRINQITKDDIPRIYDTIERCFKTLTLIPEMGLIRTTVDSWNRSIRLTQLLESDGEYWFGLSDELSTVTIEELCKCFKETSLIDEPEPDKLEKALHWMAIYAKLTEFQRLRMQTRENKEFSFDGLSFSFKCLKEEKEKIYRILQEYRSSRISKISERIRKNHEIEAAFPDIRIEQKMVSNQLKEYKEKLKKQTETLLAQYPECNSIEDAINQLDDHIAKLNSEKSVIDGEIRHARKAIKDLNEQQKENDNKIADCSERIVSSRYEFDKGSLNLREVNDKLTKIKNEKEEVKSQKQADIRDFHEQELALLRKADREDEHVKAYRHDIDRFNKSVDALNIPNVDVEERRQLLLDYIDCMSGLVDTDDLQIVFPQDGDFYRAFELDSSTTGNLISMTTNQIAKANVATFDYAIVDEASKCSFEDIVTILPDVRHLVLIGDYMQLDPFYERYEDIDEWKKYCFTNESWETFNRSGFSMLFDDAVKKNKGPGAGSFSENPYISIMKRQYRMNTDIFELIAPIYRIHDGFELIDEKKQSADDVLCINIADGMEARESDETSSYNLKEAELIANTIALMAKNREKLSVIDSIGVITGYAAQVRHINDSLRKEKLKDLKNVFKVQIGTFDRFQGREYDLVFISMVRTNSLGFLSNIRRMNVALSRAKRKLIILGNFNEISRMSVHMGKDEIEQKELRFVKDKLVPTLNNMSCRVKSDQDIYKRILHFLQA